MKRAFSAQVLHVVVVANIKEKLHAGNPLLNARMHAFALGVAEQFYHREENWKEIEVISGVYS
jgi:hypothetical protein